MRHPKHNVIIVIGALVVALSIVYFFDRFTTVGDGFMKKDKSKQHSK